MVLQRLEEEGIRPYLENEYTVTIDPILTNAIGGIRLMVPKEQLPRALELMDQFEKDYKHAAACPRCGSVNVHYITQTKHAANWISAFISWIFGSYAVAVKKVYHCFDCEHEFESLQE